VGEWKRNGFITITPGTVRAVTTFSVLICTYNRHELLDMALNALVNDTLEKPDQIVVVNGGDERANKVVKKYIREASLEIKLIKTVNVNLATSRNIGLAQCTCNIVAMTDDDAEVFPDWVMQMKRVHREQANAGAVGGAVIGADSGQSLLSRISDVTTFPSPKEPCYVRNLPGVNVSYKQEVLVKIGNQDETLFRGEDVDFNWRVKLMGYEVYYTPAIKVIHHHRPTTKGFISQFYMYGRAYYLVRRKWPEMYCVYPHKITKIRDIFKWGYFFLSIIYQPILTTRKLHSFADRIFGFPYLLMNEISWKSGMLSQFIEEKVKEFRER
jgi:GT2 family glycosyltransferase